MCHIFAMKYHLSRIRRVQPGNNAENRCFAAARCSEQHDDLVFVNGEIDILENDCLAKALAETTNGHCGFAIIHWRNVNIEIHRTN